MARSKGYASRLGMVALLCLLLGAGKLTTGCSKAPQDEKKPVTKVETTAPAKAATPVKTAEKPAEKAAAEAPASPMPKPAPSKVAVTPQSSEADILAVIGACTDPFKLYGWQQATAKRVGQSEAIRDAIEKQWLELEKSKPPQTLIEGLQCEAFKMAPAGENKAKFFFLFKVTEPVADHHLALIARVDPMHKSQLPEDAQKRGYHVWELFMRETMSKWEKGNRYLVSFEREVEPIPYRLSLILEKRDAQQRWVANVGNEVILGWHAPLS